MTRSLNQLHTTFALLRDGDNVSYVLDPELRVVVTNAAWERFAVANGGEALLATWQPGTSLLAAVPEVLQPFFRSGFALAQKTGERWEHEYECSSATLFRKYRMIAYPFGDWFVVTHALLVEHPHDREATPPTYEHAGVISVCAHCRRARSAAKPDRWDWVPAYVENPRDNLSHGLCPACFGYYYARTE